MGVADAVLRKPGVLTPEEQAEMRRHPDLGYDSLIRAEALAGVHDNEVIAPGQGDRPDPPRTLGRLGLSPRVAGRRIPLSGRIVALVDAYDAMVEGRAYRDAVSHEQAVAAIVAARGRHFDPDVVDAFLDVETAFGDWDRQSGAGGRP